MHWFKCVSSACVGGWLDIKSLRITTKNMVGRRKWCTGNGDASIKEKRGWSNLKTPTRYINRQTDQERNGAVKMGERGTIKPQSKDEKKDKNKRDMKDHSRWLRPQEAPKLPDIKTDRTSWLSIVNEEAVPSYRIGGGGARQQVRSAFLGKRYFSWFDHRQNGLLVDKQPKDQKFENKTKSLPAPRANE